MGNQPLTKGSKHMCCLFTGQVAHAVGQIDGNYSSSVYLDGLPLAVVGSTITCNDGSTATILTGSSKVFIEGKPMAILASQTSHGGSFSK
jgi:uncharacterized Zn-binding protein involved in type VI secretion